jgi:hypothetical protein
LQARLGVPVVEPLTAAVAQAEYLVRLGSHTSGDRTVHARRSRPPGPRLKWLAPHPAVPRTLHPVPGPGRP